MTNRTERRGAAKRRRGFTLIEIMAVVVIMGLLMGIVGTAVISRIQEARVGTTKAQISQLEAALGFYQMDNSRYPTTEQGLQALVRAPTSAPEPRHYNPSGYLKQKALPMDGWGNPYQYEMPGTNNPDSFDIWSLGADGQPGGTGNDADIGNWVEPTEGA
jgi:general secretion pathway protein G